ncbi:MAG: hypothetical protein RLY57_43 [Candidatus Parcubacteria bacterium]|jgi:hypothetical protein
MFGLNPSEIKILKKLNTPIKIQNFLDTLPINFEKHSETYMSVRRTLQAKTAHCFEGALIAAAALMLAGKKPLLLDLKTLDGDDHVVALYQVNGYWGAISKTNHTALRFRDPIYENIHELALSYFHEYIGPNNGKKTLYAYSLPFNLKQFKNEWLVSDQELFHIAEAIDEVDHYELYPESQKKFIRKADTMERRGATLTEWKD